MTSLVIRNLRHAIVGPVSFVVAPGTCAVIAGPSGSGKSLLLRMIADLDPNEGEVRLGEVRRADIAAPAWRHQVVHVAAEPGWWGATVDRHFPKETRDAARGMARCLGLDADVFGRTVGSLSTGEKQRLALIRALARGPKALLLDEPTSALDAASVARVETLLQDALAGGAIIVLVSHDPEQGHRLGTDRYVMTAGRLAPA